MKTNELVKILAAFLSSAAALCASDYYFGIYSGNYEASWAWFADESRTQTVSRYPNQYEDSAIFYKTSATAWITQYDTYVGDVVFAGSSSIKFGNQLPKPDNYTAYFHAGGKISAQICGDPVAAVFGTSFDSAEGAVGIDITLGGIDVGTQVYGGKTFESYSYAASLSFAFSDERITSSAIRVKGDVNVGGGLDMRSSAVLDITADKVAVEGVVNMKLNGGSYSNILFQKATVFEIGGLNATSERNDFTICNTGGFSSDIVFKNAAGTDFQFIGNICDDGNSLQRRRCEYSNGRGGHPKNIPIHVFGIFPQSIQRATEGYGFLKERAPVYGQLADSDGLPACGAFARGRAVRRGAL